MGRRIARLTLDHLDALQAPCRTCLFWELDPVRRGRLGGGADAAAEKDAWVSLVLREWGSCGRVALVDDEPVGYATYAPPAFFGGTAVFPTAPVGPDAVLLSAVWVHPAFRGGGLGRMLVQGMARDLVERGGAAAVEAFADTRGHGRGCTMPAEFLSSVGFKTQRAHATTPRMRMDLRSAVGWRDEVEAALERLLGAVRPAPKAHPDQPRGTHPREGRPSAGGPSAGPPPGEGPRRR